MIIDLISKLLPKRENKADALPTEWPEPEPVAAPSWQEKVPTDIGQISRKGTIFVFGFLAFSPAILIKVVAEPTHTFKKVDIRHSFSDLSQFSFLFDDFQLDQEGDHVVDVLRH